jgi:hypothetical protein
MNAKACYCIGTGAQACSERVSIGLYDSDAAPKSLKPTSAGFSIAAATRAAESLALEHHQHRDEGGRSALLAAQDKVKRAAEEAKRLAATHTLGNLLDAYCDHLEAIGRRSHKDARSIFKLHVEDAWPKIAGAPAREVTGEQFADMMRTLIEARQRPHRRQAAQLRACRMPDRQGRQVEAEHPGCLQELRDLNEPRRGH